MVTYHGDFVRPLSAGPLNGRKQSVLELRHLGLGPLPEVGLRAELFTLRAELFAQLRHLKSRGCRDCSKMKNEQTNSKFTKIQSCKLPKF